MNPYVSNVLGECVQVAQEIEALTFDDKLCPIWTPHPQRNPASVVLKFDSTAMRREGIGEYLRDALICKWLRRMSGLDDGRTISQKHVDYPSNNDGLRMSTVAPGAELTGN